MLFVSSPHYTLHLELLTGITDANQGFEFGFPFTPSFTRVFFLYESQNPHTKRVDSFISSHKVGMMVNFLNVNLTGLWGAQTFG